jgi:hypothetical protein
MWMKVVGPEVSELQSKNPWTPIARLNMLALGYMGPGHEMRAVAVAVLMAAISFNQC